MQKIVFLGSHLQSFRCLRYLLSLPGDHEVIAIVRNQSQTSVRPDQDVRSLAEANGIPLLLLEDLTNLSFDLGISLLFDRILPTAVFDRPSKGFVNFHLGPLPRLRGSNSVMHAIRLARSEGIWEFGVTLHYIDKKVDTGPIIDIHTCPIFEDDTAYSLHTRACDCVFELFRRNIIALIESSGRVPSNPQHGPSIFFKKGQVDHEVDLSGPPLEIYDQIRALTFPGKPKPFATIGGHKIYLSLEDT